MPTVLIVDDMPIVREPLAAAFRLAGYKPMTAANGNEALTAVQAESPDVILLDVMMPKMDAWGFLRVLRSQSQWKHLPVILLTVSADKDSILAARKFGVQEYLLKGEFSLEQMLTRVGRCIGPKVTPPVSVPSARAPGSRPAVETVLPSQGRPPESERARLTREETISRVEKYTQARSLAGAVAQVIALASSPRGSMADLVMVLKRDPVLSARILKAANSTAFATNKPQITTIEEAVRNIGLKTVRNLAASVGIVEAFASDAVGGLEQMRCWQHCFAVAALMDRLVPKSEEEARGIAHLVGLCHDLGEIVLRQHFAPEYAAAMKLAAESGKPLQQAQSAVFGISQHELTGIVLAKLGLPPAIITPTQEFFHWSDSPSERNVSPLVRALKFANNYAHGLLLSSSTGVAVSPITESDYRKCVTNPTEVIDGQALRGEVLMTTSLLARAAPADEAALLEPLIPQSSAKVWYARHTSFSTFDPLGAALQLLAQVELNSGLPVGPELTAGCRGIVVAAPSIATGPPLLDPIESIARSPGAKNVPVLCLAGGDPKQLPASRGQTRFMAFPISLAALKQFISEL